MIVDKKIDAIKCKILNLKKEGKLFLPSLDF